MAKAISKHKRGKKMEGGASGPMFAKRTLPFLFTIVGAVVILVAGVATIAYTITAGKLIAAYFVNKYNIDLPFQMIYRAVLVSGAIGILSGLVLLGVGVTINTHKRGKIVASGMVGLAFSLLSLLNGGGFYIGFILAFMGSLLAIIYNKT
ncbi:MAG: hypothetical protein ACP5SJ_02335 [Candidatus Micrarchaeia archaeon]